MIVNVQIQDFLFTEKKNKKDRLMKIEHQSME